MSTLADRLRATREERGLNKTQLKALARLKSASTLSELENGTTFHSPQLPNIAEALGVSAYWLRTGKGEKESSKQHKNHEQFIESRKASDDIVIYQFDTGGRMGNGLVLQDQPGVIESWRVSKEWASKNIKNCSSLVNLVVVTGFGDSMRPMFNPGDPLLVDTGVKEMTIDAVYFFRVGNEGYIKRIQRIPSKDGTIYRVKSANPDYETWEVTAGMDIEVFGRVLKVWRGEDM